MQVRQNANMLRILTKTLRKQKWSINFTLLITVKVSGLFNLAIIE